MDKKFGGEDFGSTLAELKAMAPHAQTVDGVRFEGNAKKVSAILTLAGVGGELIAEIEYLRENFQASIDYMNEGCICGRAPQPKHPVDARLRKRAKSPGVNAELLKALEGLNALVSGFSDEELHGPWKAARDAIAKAKAVQS